MVHGIAHGHNLLSQALRRLDRKEEALQASQIALDAIAQATVVGESTIMLDQGELLINLDSTRKAFGEGLIRRAGELVVEQSERIQDTDSRMSFLSRQRNQKILTRVQLLE